MGSCSLKEYATEATLILIVSSKQLDASNLAVSLHCVSFCKLDCWIQTPLFFNLNELLL